MESALHASQVAEAADAYLEALRAGRRPEVEDFAAQYPEIAQVLRDMLPALAALEDSRGGDSSNDDHAAGAPDEALRELGDFHLIREVGRGGMGVVYEAWQQSLGRRVAIKVLPFAAALDARQLQRFKNEAQAAAQLHHTHIVPVYAVGSERGVHYYAMQFIEGRSVATLVDELRVARGQAPSGSSDHASPADVTTAHGEAKSGGATKSGGSAARDDSTRGLLQATTARSPQRQGYFRQVARLGAEAAQALEHSHSLGIVHRDIKPGNLMIDVHGHLWVTDFGLAQMRSDSRLTMTGDLVGTLRYMSPEQLLAGRVPVDHRCDIYSLGATLYELLTLEPAISGDDRQALLRQISFDDPPPARKIDRAVPAELETIVGKAMAKNPADRYGTAQEFVDDLERFLRDEPIRARRPTLRQHVQKWAARHRELVATGAIAGVLLLLLLAVGAGIFAAQQRQLASGRAHTLAVERAARQQAQDAVNDYFKTVSEDVLFSQPGMQPLRQRLLERARQYFEQFAREGGADPSLASEVAETNVRLGDIARSLGQDAEAEARYRDAIDRFGQLEKSQPLGPKPGCEYGAALTGLARLQAAQGQFPAARENYERAIDRLAQLVARQPLEADPRRRLGAAQQSLGQLEMQLGETERGAPRFDEALVHLRAAAAGHKDEFVYQDALASCLGNLGMVALVSGKFPQALQHYQEALGVRQAMLKQQPGHPVIQSGIARYWHGVASAHSEMGHAAEAAEALAQAQAMREKVVHENPRVLEYREQWARGFFDLADQQQQAGQIAEALATAEQGVVGYRALVEQAPDVLDHRLGLAEALLQVARIQQDSGDPSLSRGACQEAVDVFRALADAHPDVPQFREGLGKALLRLTSSSAASSDFDTERQATDQALELFGPLYAEAPADHRRFLVEAWHNRGLAAKRRRDWDEARAAFARAVELNEARPADEAPTDVALRQLAGDHVELGLVDLHQGRAEEAASRFESARQAAGDNASALWQMTRALGRGCGEFTTASDRAACLDAAFAALRAATAAGFADTEALRSHADLAALREDARFEELASAASPR